jgi:hypothetical protein
MEPLVKTPVPQKKKKKKKEGGRGRRIESSSSRQIWTAGLYWKGMAASGLVRERVLMSRRMSYHSAMDKKPLQQASLPLG